MAKKKTEPKKKKVSAEELGPEAFTDQKDYEEQVALEKEAKPEEKPEESK